MLCCSPDSNCEVCHNGSGRCKTCFRGMAISKATGKCTNCKDENCITCDGSLKKCRTCYTCVGEGELPGW